MKDLVTNGSGNSRFLKSSIPDGTTWAEALALFRSGAFPIDLNGLNPAGVSQTGSAYSKGNVLPDALCTALGISTATAEPKDAFSALNDKINTNYQTYQDFVSNDWTEPGKIGVARANMLENWFFVGGGSQQGGGQFPVNQKGSTSYTAAGYAIDRWKKANANGTTSVTANGLSIVGTGSAWNYMEQPIEFSGKLFGRQVTISMLNASGALSSATYTLPSSLPGSDTNYATVSAIGSVSFDLRGNSSYFYVRLGASAASTTAIVAVKLELGPNQTLARKVNNTWILNEMPVFQQELAKCQRFMYVFPRRSTGSYYQISDLIGVGWYPDGKNYMYGFVPVPVPMRANPTLSGTLYIRTGGTSMDGLYSFSTSDITLYTRGNLICVYGYEFGIGTTDTTKPQYILGIGNRFDANL